MYVDDEESIVFVMSRVLQRLGYRSTTFTNPHIALQAFRTNPSGFDGVVTDLSMPGMSGLELAAELLQIRPDLGIALSSGTRDEAEAAKRVGIKVLIPKPATVEELASGLHSLFRSTKGSSAAA
jgi:CheY-like chemotaxis protein